MRCSAKALLRISASPGSAPHVATHTTSCPAAVSAATKRREKQLSTSSLTGRQHRREVLVAHDHRSVEQACLYVLELEPLILLDQTFGRVSGGEHLENVLHGQAAAADDRLAAVDLGIERDSFQEIVPVHAPNSTSVYSPPMCGINAIYAYGDTAPPIDRDELIATRECLRSRGPDAAGQWLSPGGRVGLGHRRLAIIDLSPAGAQPQA